jgi:small conductance mechanosensitive channel
MNSNELLLAIVDPELLEKLQDKGLTFLFDVGPKLFAALLILVAGVLVSAKVGKALLGFLNKKELEPPVRILIVRIVRLVLMGVTLMIALEKLGMSITPLLAGLGVAGVGVGLALQGVLGNLMAGMLIIFTKPFRVGEYIELLGVHGQVHAIELFSVILAHPDRSRVVIPNRKIIGEVLHNYGTIRQLDLSVGVAYSTDLNKALHTVNAVLARIPTVLKDPAPVVGVASFGDSAVNIAIRPWAKVSDFGPAGAAVNQAIAEEFRRHGIEIPFPQREIRVLNGGAIRAA